MTWVDWIVVALVVCMAMKAQKYVKGVADFLAAGRYVLLNDFFAAVRGEVKNTSTLEQGLLSTMIAEAAERSREENRVVLPG